jgi:hypothetical protein
VVAVLELVAVAQMVVQGDLEKVLLLSFLGAERHRKVHCLLQLEHLLRLLLVQEAFHQLGQSQNLVQ